MVLRDEDDRALGTIAHGRGELGEEVHRAVVLQGVRGVEAQAVDVVLVDPMQRVLDEEPSHLRLQGPSRLTPRPHGL